MIIIIMIIIIIIMMILLHICLVWQGSTVIAIDNIMHIVLTGDIAMVAAQVVCKATASEFIFHVALTAV